MSGAAERDLMGKVQTVLGPIDGGEMGVTITHEHLLMTACHIAREPEGEPDRTLYHEPVSMKILGRLRYGKLVNLDNCQLHSVDTAIFEAGLFKAAGGQTIVDATSLGIGRHPVGLEHIARATGLNIVMGASFYVEETYPAELELGRKSEGEIAAMIARDILVGVGESGIRAGLIGEVGCSWPLTKIEQKILRASARAQRMTGAPLMVHPGRDRAAPAQIAKILDAAGADLSRTIICHIDRTLDSPELLNELAVMGCALEYDLFGFEHSYYPWVLPVDMPNDLGRLRWLRWLIDKGYLSRIVISHDICFKDKLSTYGGAGYAHILNNVVPLMRTKGFTEYEIAAILVQNPRRLFSFA